MNSLPKAAFCAQVLFKLIHFEDRSLKGFTDLFHMYLSIYLTDLDTA
jgi:hypothetical protein